MSWVFASPPAAATPERSLGLWDALHSWLRAQQPTAACKPRSDETQEAASPSPPTATGLTQGTTDLERQRHQPRALPVLAHHHKGIGPSWSLVPKPAPWRIMLASVSPRILIIDHFLDDELCEALMSRALPNLQRSMVGNLDEPARVSTSRTSQSTAATPHLRTKVQEQVSHLINCPEARAVGRMMLKPAEGEVLEVVRYQQGDVFLPHYDNRAGCTARRRAASLIVYLSDVPAGGTTWFSNSSGVCATAIPLHEVALRSGQQHDDLTLPRPGLRVHPQKGRAIFFWSCLANGNQDRHSRHCSEPVLEGEKWVATQFFADTMAT